MWSDFYVSAVVLAAILLVPGYLALRAAGMARPTSACCAPIVSITLLSVLGQLLAFAGIPSSPLVLGIVVGGSLVDSNFRRAVLAGKGDMSPFVTRPISLVLILILVFIIAKEFLWPVIKAKRDASGAEKQ